MWILRGLTLGGRIRGRMNVLVWELGLRRPVMFRLWRHQQSMHYNSQNAKPGALRVKGKVKARTSEAII